MEAQLYLSYSYRGGLGYDNRFPKMPTTHQFSAEPCLQARVEQLQRCLGSGRLFLLGVYFQESSHHGLPQLQGSKHPPVKAQNTSPPPPPPPQRNPLFSRSLPKPFSSEQKVLKRGFKYITVHKQKRRSNDESTAFSLRKVVGGRGIEPIVKNFWEKMTTS